MDTDERALFAGAIGRATDRCEGGILDAALAELGWADALSADRATAIAVLFEAQGVANATSSALDQVLSAALPAPEGLRAAVILPLLRTVEPPGRVESGRVAVSGLGTNALARAEVAIVATEGEGGTELVVVPAAALKTVPIAGLDEALGLVEVSGQIDQPSSSTSTRVDWNGAVAAGQLALGHELVGTGRAMLELARRHALERMQFGRPIASFQAVRHRLAESFIALEAAASLLAAAGDEPAPVTAAMAKGLAGRSARTVARHCQQVLAGIGFTTEHGLHRFVRRTYVLDQLLGAGSIVTAQLGAEVLAVGTLPASFPL